jgi:2'-5' RNA ligase
LSRIFIAVDLPERVRRAAAGLRSEIRGARWTREEHMHLTLRFLGEVDAPRTEALTAQLSRVALEGFSLELRGIGRFPRAGPARVLWAGIEPEEPARRLHDLVEAAVARAGLPAEEKPFAPHMTLARLSVAPRRAVEAFLEKGRGFSAGPFSVRGFALYSSVLTSSGPIHRLERVFALEVG